MVCKSAFQGTVGVLVFASILYADDFTSWQKSAVLNVNTIPGWTTLKAPVTDFPLLVRLDSSHFKFGEAKAMGADLRFAKADGTTPLAFEIERWDAAAGAAAIWVRIDTINPNESRAITLFWSNAAALPAGSPSMVFDTAQGYLGVWHLSDSASSSLNRDATVRAAHGLKKQSSGGSVITVAPSPLGTGQRYNSGFDPVSAQYNFNWAEVDSGKIDFKNKNVTISAWAKRDGLNSGDYFLAQGTQDPDIGMRFGFDYLDKFSCNFWQTGSDAATEVYTSLDWHYWVGAYSIANNRMVIYRDGDSVASSTLPRSFQGSGPFTFCWSYGASGQWYHARADMDEVRVSAMVRNAAWVALEYANQKEEQRLVSLPVPAGAVKAFAIDKTSAAITEGNSVTIAGQAVGAQSYEWVRVDSGVEIPLVFQNGLLIDTPRVSGSSTVTYRFKAWYNTGYETRDAAVQVAEAIPDPIFTLAVPQTVDGSDPGTPFTIVPDITNRAAVAASAAPEIHFLWNCTGDASFIPVESNDTLMLYFTGEVYGPVTISLTLDNGGKKITRQATVTVYNSAGIKKNQSPAMKQTVSYCRYGNSLMIRNPGAGRFLVSAYSLAGKLLWSKSAVGPAVHRIPLPATLRGACIIRVEDKNKITVIPMVAIE